MFDCLTLVILHSASLEKLIGAHKPVENIFETLFGAFKKWVFSLWISDTQRFMSEVFKKFHQSEILTPDCQKDRRLSIKILLETLCWLHLKQSLCKSLILSLDCFMQRNVSLDGIFGENVDLRVAIQ